MSRYINFYDPALRLKRDWLALDVLAWAGVALLLILAVTTLALRQHVRGLETEASDLASRVESLKQNRDQWTQQRSLADQATQARTLTVRQEIETHTRVLAQLEQADPAAPTGYADLMRAFARQHRQGLWLTGFTLDSGRQQLELRGRSLDAEFVPQYVQRLRQEAALAGYRFDDLRLSRPSAEKSLPDQKEAAEPPYLEFSLTNQLPNGDAPAAGAPRS